MSRFYSRSDRIGASVGLLVILGLYTHDVVVGRPSGESGLDRFDIFFIASYIAIVVIFLRPLIVINGDGCTVINPVTTVSFSLQDIERTSAATCISFELANGRTVTSLAMKAPNYQVALGRHGGATAAAAVQIQQWADESRLSASPGTSRRPYSRHVTAPRWQELAVVAPLLLEVVIIFVRQQA